MIIKDSYTDEHLFADIAQGDESAFAALYSRYDRMLTHFLLKLTRGDESTAAEIIQETFLRIWLNRERLGTIEHPRAYIHRIASNLSHDWLKRFLLGEQADQAHHFRLPVEVNDVQDWLDSKDLSELIARIIAEMPDQRQAIYRLHRDSGLSSAEIARRLQLSDSTVRNTIAAAIRFIRDRLVESGYTLAAFLYFLKNN